MSATKLLRDGKRQLGQFFTPSKIAHAIVNGLDITASSIVLEPSAGDGAFVIPLVRRLYSLQTGTHQQRIERVLTHNMFAIEIDPIAHATLLMRLDAEFGRLPARHNIQCGDFFTKYVLEHSSERPLSPLPCEFDVIAGNPPFGGSIEPTLQNRLDQLLGVRDGAKIKKETYCWFIVRCVELLRPGGVLQLISSDTFLTIPTMKGLREFLLNRGQTLVRDLKTEFEETKQPMVVLEFTKTGSTDHVRVQDRVIDRESIDLTGNRSWRVSNGMATLFDGPTLGEYMVASSGMTIGKNELFLREIHNGSVEEPYRFEFFDDPITLKRETERARLGQLSPGLRAKIARQEQLGASRRNVRAIESTLVRRVTLPDPDYCFYNKATSEIVYAPPKWVVFWKDDGDAVLTFKKNGNWYLHGVGGMPFFKREGVSWRLISQTLNIRYLPAGYILDSGAPCAFLRPGVEPSELWFILGWCLTPLCTKVLKDVLNHTRNIQSKDFERLPYPHWVAHRDKTSAIRRVQHLVASAVAGRIVARTDGDVHELCGLYCSHPNAT